MAPKTFKPFSELHAAINPKLEAVCKMETGRFCYVKVVQHAMTYSENKSTDKLIAGAMTKGNWSTRLHYILRHLSRRPKLPNIDWRDTAILEQGRVVKDDRDIDVSFYFDTIVSTIGRDRCTILSPEGSPLPSDCSTASIPHLANLSLDALERGLLKEVKEAYNRFGDSGVFSPSELAYVGSALHVFFEEFHAYYHLLRNSGIKRFIFENHYHREGMIAACKVLGIEAIEIQHGLIAENDLYYCYPEFIKSVRDRALFPDLLLLYGDYWKKLILKGHEHTSESLAVVGCYNYGAHELTYDPKDKENLILVGAQKNMPEVYVDYIRQLSQVIAEKHTSWRIVVKLHPFEKEVEKYLALAHEIGGIKIVTSGDIIPLLKSSKIQISIYSTTFYDALGLDVLNLSIQDYGYSWDYARDVVKEGVAHPISFADDPVEIYEQARQNSDSFLPRSAVYAKFDVRIFLKSLKLRDL